MIWRIELQHHELDWFSLISVKRFDWIDHTDALIGALGKAWLSHSWWRQYCHHSHCCRYCNYCPRIISGFCGCPNLFAQDDWDGKWWQLSVELLQLLLRLFTTITPFIWESHQYLHRTIEIGNYRQLMLWLTFLSKCQWVECSNNWGLLHSCRSKFAFDIHCILPLSTYIEYLESKTAQKSKPKYIFLNKLELKKMGTKG